MVMEDDLHWPANSQNFSQLTFSSPSLRNALRNASNSERPAKVRLMSLLWTLTFPISVLVCLAFWTLINPVWDQKMRPGFAARHGVI